MSHTKQKNIFSIAAVALFIFVAYVAFSAAPGFAFADEPQPYAHNEEDGVKYYSVKDAWESARAGKTVVMDRDWEPDFELKVDSGKTVTLKLNNYAINRCHGGRVFYVGSSATLKLIGDKAADKRFLYRLGEFRDWSAINSGGLITGGSGDKVNGVGVFMESKSSLEMENVALAGNYAAHAFGAGLYMSENCKLVMNNSHIDGNMAESFSEPGGIGGGIYIAGSGVSVEMKKSGINYNAATGGLGGGIYSNATHTTINLKENSTISENYAYTSGGAVYFDETYFKLIGDGTSSISNNYLASLNGKKGTAVGMDSVWVGGNESEIKGLTFKGNNNARSDTGYCGAIAVNQEWVTIENCEFRDNRANSSCDAGAIFVNNDNTRIFNCLFDNNSARRGGAIYIDSEDTTIANCTFTNNTARDYGGAVYNNNDDTIIRDCTIKSNSAAHVGGGIYTDCLNDISIHGKTVIKENSRWSDTSADDDLFLDSTWPCYAYSLGDVEKGSEIGIRTDVDGDRCLVEDLTNYIEGTFFLDLSDSYHLSYDSSDDELWQREGSYEYLVTVNGSGSARYKAKTQVTVLDNNTDKSKVFKCWSDDSTGIALSDEQKKSKLLTFKMLCNDVHLKATYVTRTKTAQIVIDEPKAGEALPTKGTFSWLDMDTGKMKEEEVSLTWKEVQGDTETTVSGVAKYNTSYRVQAIISEDVDNNRAFDYSISKDDTKMYVGSEDLIDSSKVRETDGTLSMTSKVLTTEKLQVAEIDSESLSIQEGISSAELLSALPDFAVARLSNDDAVSLSVDKENVSLPESLIKDGVVVVPDRNTVSVELPVESSGIDTQDQLTLTVNVTVTSRSGSEEAVAAPELDRESGTYEGKSLQVKTDYASDEAQVYYQVDDGEVQAYDNDEGITLAGSKGKKSAIRLKVWAQKGDASSEVRSYTYILDDSSSAASVNKVTITCRDTGNASKWSDTSIVECGQDSVLNAVAPTEEGRKFSCWEWGSVPEGFDKDAYDISGSEVSISNPPDGLELVAVYNPVITDLSITMDEPKSSQALPGSIGKIEARVAIDAEAQDATAFFDVSNLTWAPEGKDGKADYDTTYTVSVSQIEAASSGVKYALSDSLTVTVNGKSSSAYVVKEDGKYVLSFTCLRTEKGELNSVTGLSDMEIPFEKACSWQDDQSEADEKGLNRNCWHLPQTTQVSLKDGSVVDASINWETPTGFDKNKLSEQSIAVKGTVVLPEYLVNSDGIDLNLGLTLKVQAPESVLAPTVDIAPGTYKEGFNVKLSCETSGAVVYYTLDGSDPTETSTMYDGSSIVVDKDATIKAIATKPYMKTSEVAVFEYTINPGSADPVDPDNSDSSDASSGSDVDSDDSSAEDKADANDAESEKASDDSAEESVSADTGDSAVFLPVAVMALLALVSVISTRSALRRKRSL